MSAAKNHRVRFCYLSAPKVPVTEIPVPALAVVRRCGPTACRSCYDAHQSLALFRHVFEHYGYLSTKNSELHLSQEFPLLHQLSVDGLLLSYLKLKTAALFAAGTGSELPEVPYELLSYMGTKVHVFVGGGYCAFFERMKRQTNSVDTTVRRRSLSFLYSLLMLKKGLPRPSRASCQAAVVKAYQTMTTPTSRSRTDLLAIDSVREKLKVMVKKLFNKEDYNELCMLWPSQSSHFGWSRKKEGALGAVRSLDMLPKGQRWVVDWSMEEIMDEDVRYYVVMDESSINELRELQSKMVALGCLEEPVCAPQALPEPLKIRVVTAGPPITYTALKPVQKMLFRAVSRDPRFAISAPLDADQLSKRLGRLKEGNMWLSGDYKAATDNLAIELSDYCVELIADRTEMPFLYRELFHRSMTGHIYTYDKNFGKGTPDWAEKKPQLRGQLMGSPVSFPILCLVNFALIWDTVFPETEHFRDVEVIVNGDDCIFQCDEFGKHSWEDGAKAIGLAPSVGKTYHSGKFLVMNSEMYDYSDNGDLDYIPYINYGLLLGIKKSGDKEISCMKDDDDKQSMTVGARAHAVLRGIVGAERDVLIEQFRYYNQDLLVAGVPFFIREDWGGFGLPMGSKDEHDQRDLKRLAFLVGNEMLGRDVRCEYKMKSPKTHVPYYNRAIRSLIDKYGSCRTENNYSVGKYQWLVSGNGLPEEVEGNNDEVRKFWNKTDLAMIDIELMNNLDYFDIASYYDRHSPKREVPVVQVANHTLASVVGITDDVYLAMRMYH